MIFQLKSLRWGLLLLAPLVIFGCDDDDTVTGSGQLRIELTDGPLDDPNVSGVFVTVAEVRVDGKVWEGLTSKQTIELSALQNGNVQSLGVGAVDAKTYDQISVVLDLETDENGNAPGCYLRTTDNVKHDIAATAASSMEIQINGPDYKVVDEGSNTIVVDMDLRKALRYGNPNEPSSDYSFGSGAEVAASFRYVVKESSGSIKGHVTDAVSGSDDLVVYAYTKGNFNRTQEMSPTSDEQFAHAVTSTRVNAQGDYTLAFLEPGQYEVVFASYKDEGSNGTLDLQGTLELSTLLGLDPKAITVSTASTVTLNITVLSVLP